ncbi:heterokaryon incompatibility protein-domain-containing protein [Podospora fimiseda]|uniref:Heterokaryon incompatibility protein-domain-containing protein n=1 Tax=Podospora fimiseda TaxID=252190 RepID=A0AAN6YK63_9PEZI|nr:heterokaryon incompatibility protein-domain-containing protein [Podospora fimiseda]
MLSRWRVTIRSWMPQYHHQCVTRLISYPYSPLSSPQSVRLLELHRESGDDLELSCTLKEFPLEKAPAYHALSYTWDDALTPFSKGAYRRPPGTAIICNGKPINILPNLHDALQELSAGDLWPTKHLWIDALSINQADTHERNSQVRMMSDIFSRAESVVAWLGVEDQFTRDAMKVIEAIPSIPRTAWELSHYLTFLEPFRLAEFYEEFGMPLESIQVSYNHWAGFLALMSRPWFKRAWIVQEIALAQFGTMMLGRRRFRWDQLDRVLSFLRGTRWYRHLSAPTLRRLTQTWAGEPISSRYREFLQSDVEMGAYPLYLARTKRSFSFYMSAPNSRALSLGMLMETHRYTLAKDPRDKVYAFLGLADKRLPPFVMFPELAEPDYSLSVRDVYLKVSKDLMLSSGGLGLLSHVNHVEKSGVDGVEKHDLPSWVPDYSMNCERLPLAVCGDVPWDVCGGKMPEWKPDSEKMDDGVLVVQGYKLDTVEAIASTRREATAGKKGFWQDGVVKLAAGLEREYRLPDRDGRCHSPFEVAWRTLIANTFDRKHPAPEWCGNVVLKHLLVRQGSGYQLGLGNDGELSKESVKIWADSHPELTRIICPGETELEGLKQVLERCLQRPPEPEEYAQLWHETRVSSGIGRRMFRSLGGFLGLGPETVNLGDEVWILSDGQVPFVLRKIGGVEYQFIGEAYVHGIMFGGGIPGLEKRGDLKEIFIV